MEPVKYLKNIEIEKDDCAPGLVAIKAKGMAEMGNLLLPLLVPRTIVKIPDDGMYEMDFILDRNEHGNITVEMEVDIVFRLEKLPSWVKGVRIFALENSDIELL